MKLTAIAVLVLVATEWCSAQIIPPPFYNTGGAIAYLPIVDTVFSGVQMEVQPTVSRDRKYVTLGVRTELSSVISIVTFPVVAGAGGAVGGAAPAPIVPGVLPPDPNVSAPVRVNTGQGGSVLRRAGMTRLVD